MLKFQKNCVTYNQLMTRFGGRTPVQLIVQERESFKNNTENVNC